VVYDARPEPGGGMRYAIGEDILPRDILDRDIRLVRDLGVEHLKGVGPSMKAKLERLGIFRLGDLLAHLPMRYQDRSRLVPLDRLRADAERHGREAEAVVRSQPGTALGIAAGLGFLVGLMAARR